MSEKVSVNEVHVQWKVSGVSVKLSEKWSELKVNNVVRINETTAKI